MKIRINVVNNKKSFITGVNGNYELYRVAFKFTFPFLKKSFKETDFKYLPRKLKMFKKCRLDITEAYRNS